MEKQGMETARALREAMEQAMKNRIRVEYGPMEGPVKLGAGKFGGRPHLPEGFLWPWYRGTEKRYEKKKFLEIPIHRPLSFLCQIDLSEAAPLDKDGLLPKSGLLSFFYEVESQPWGYQPEHKDGARVYWFPEGTKLTETDFPAEMQDYCRFPELAISLEAVPCLPDWADLDRHVPAAELMEEDDYDRYRELAEEMGGPWEYASHLLGYPNVIQNPMEEECEQVSRGYNCGCGPIELSPEEAAEMEAAAGDWMLLFQMGSVDDGKGFELIFGECGCIYFWIRKQDLKERDFSRVRLILQCG